MDAPVYHSPLCVFLPFRSRAKELGFQKPHFCRYWHLSQEVSTSLSTASILLDVMTFRTRIVSTIDGTVTIVTSGAVCLLLLGRQTRAEASGRSPATVYRLWPLFPRYELPCDVTVKLLCAENGDVWATGSMGPRFRDLCTSRR
jgi:hypothetical protein